MNIWTRSWVKIPCIQFLLIFCKFTFNKLWLNGRLRTNVYNSLVLDSRWGWNSISEKSSNIWNWLIEMRQPISFHIFFCPIQFDRKVLVEHGTWLMEHIKPIVRSIRKFHKRNLWNKPLGQSPDCPRIMWRPPIGPLDDQGVVTVLWPEIFFRKY